MADDETLPQADRVAGHPHPRETLRLIGQDAAERVLLDAMSAGRMHHAWMLRGPAGVGKATLAYRVARTLIADDAMSGPAPDAGAALFADLPAAPAGPATLDPPPDCPVRARMLAQSEPRLAVLRCGLNDRGRLYTQIRIDEVRQIRGFLGLSAADGGWRAVIVDAADEMNVAAQNALLKTLEEPPARTVLLLVTHAPARLLPTIRSRCRTLDLAPLAPDALAAALAQAGAEVPPGHAAALAELAGGSVGAALRFIAEDGLELAAKIVGILGAGGSGVDRPAMIALAESGARRGNEARFALILELAATLAARFARHGAGRPAAAEIAPGEAAVAQYVASGPAAARLWAEAAGRIATRGAHARAVNLDPAQTIMDTFLDFDETMARTRRAA